MAAAGLPAVQVQLDDVNNGGTWPYDISTYFRLTEGYTITRGRSDELSQPQPGTLSLTLDNTDGRFTLGSTTGGYGAINVDRAIRVRVTPTGGFTRNRFTGYVQAWPTDWPSGSDLFSRVQITATDAMARWARRTLRSVIEEESRLDTPLVAHYPLGEPAGATSVTDTVAGSGVPMTLNGTGAAPVFGTATGPGVDGLTAATFAGGKTLTRLFSGGFYGFGCIYQIATIPGQYQFFLQTPTSAVGIVPGTGAVFLQYVNNVGASVQVDSGLNNTGAGYKSLLLENNGSGTINVYVDTAQVIGVTNATSTPLGTSATVGLMTGDLAHVSFRGAGLVGTPRASRRATLASAGLVGNLQEVTQSVAAYVGAGTGMALIGTPGTTIPWVDFTGKSALDVIEAAANAEQGTVYVNGGGIARVTYRNAAPGYTTPAQTFTVSSDIVAPDIEVQGDMAAVINYATGSRDGVDGAATLAYGDAASEALHGRYSQSYAYQVSTDAEVADRIGWVVNTHAQPVPRIPDLTLDLLAADAAVQDATLAREVGERVALTGLPAQSPTGTTADLVIEGYSETLNKDAWALALNVDSWTAYVQAFILNDATYGVLDSNRLGV